MRCRCWLLPVLLLVVSSLSAQAGLTPNDVVVVVNNHPSVAAVSRAVGEYYCNQRAIPLSNILEVTVTPNETIGPSDFVNNIQVPLKNFLQSRFGVDPNNAAADPIKAVVLCYGVPMRIVQGERYASVDSALTLLFNSTPWGLEPVAMWGVDLNANYSAVANPYYESYVDTPDYLERSKATNFSEFRASTQNDWTRDPSNTPPPAFSLIRMLDTTHALAATDRDGGLFRGTRLESGQWEWTSVQDKDKGFIIFGVSDICVLDAQHAWASTRGGSIITTSNGGQSWTTVRYGSQTWIAGPDMYDSISSVSFYNEQHGWAVGSTVSTRFVERWDNGVKSNARGDLPSDFYPEAITAIDAGHVWISGRSESSNRGIWFSSNGGIHWVQQYCPPDWTGVGDIWVRRIGDTYVGWAVTLDGSTQQIKQSKILRTTDGTNWTALDEPTLPSTSVADLSVFDDSHAAIAYRSGSFLIFNGSSWITDDSDTSNTKYSVAWAGGDIIAANMTERAIWLGQGSPGAFSWSQSYANSPMHWKIRYLVCRLDGYPTPVDPTTGIPQDVKNMIDRAVRASNAGKSALQDARFLIDDASGGRQLPDNLANALRNIVGTANVKHEKDLSKYLNHEQNVIGYTSNGSYDSGAADACTTWYRPFNTWIDGAIGIYLWVSFDGRTTRNPNYFYGYDLTGTITSGKLTITGMPQSSPYVGYWAGLYSATGDQELARAEFTQIVDNTKAAVIDLSGINWPTDGRTYIEVHFPANDPLHGNECTYTNKAWPSTEIYNARTSGITMKLRRDQCLAAELIREGCTAATGNVNEPYAWACSMPHFVLPNYALGCTWAESAYLGYNVLGWQEIALGDPLMAPYSDQVPNVSITAPEQPIVSDTILVTATAQSRPNPATGIKRVEFWVTNQNNVYKYLGIATQAPFTVSFDTTAIADGSYWIRAVAYENNIPGEAAESLLPIIVANNTSPTDISFNQPSTNGAQLSDTETLVINATNPSVITRIDFWLCGTSGYSLLSSGTSYTHSLDTTVHPDGNYSLYAVAYWTNTGSSGIVGCRRDVVISNAGIVQIADPSVDGTLASGILHVDVTVSTAGPPPVSKVELWLSGEGQADHVVATDYAYPYSFDLNTSTITNGVDGVYTLRAVAYKSPDDKPIINTANRAVIVNNGYTHYDRIRLARARPDYDSVALQNLEVTSGTEGANDGAFYVEESDRSAGIRVAWTGSTVPAGKIVSILGSVENNISTGERQIVADKVWIGGDVTPPIKPVGLINKIVGGGALTGESYTNGVSDIGQGTNIPGLYNVGLLVRVIGKVVYVGDDFIYIDDGSNIQDGNSLYPPTVVDLNGGPITPSTAGVKGLKVYFGNLPKPGIDDFVSITGISSLLRAELPQGTRYVRMIRAKDSEAVTYHIGYTPATIVLPGFKGPDGTILPQGTKIRLVEKFVSVKQSTWFRIQELGLPSYGADVMASTQLQYGDYVTVVGTIAPPGTVPRVTPDKVYRKESGQEFGALSVSASSETSVNDAEMSWDGPFRPWPGPTIEEILASPWFREHYNQVGAIGWALSQPNGAVIDLLGEQVTDEWYDGRMFGLKESFEPGVGGPKLLLYLDNPVKGLGNRMYSIDIIGGTLTTLSNGQRVIVKPRAVYAYTDPKGRYMFAVPLFKWIYGSTNNLDSSSSMRSLDDPFDIWPWKVQIAP